MKKTLTWTLSILLLGFQCAGIAFAQGHEMGNGGDANEVEFSMIGYGILESLKVNPGLLPQISRKDLAEKLFAAKVESKDQVLYDRNGVVRMALNYREAVRIEFNAKSWEGLQGNFESKMGLVAHEYFGLLGAEINEYDLSMQLRGIASEVSAITQNILPIRLVGFADPFFVVKTSAYLCTADNGKKNVVRAVLAKAYEVKKRQVELVLPVDTQLYNTSISCNDFKLGFRAKNISELKLLDPSRQQLTRQALLGSTVGLKFSDQNRNLVDIDVGLGVGENSSLSMQYDLCSARFQDAEGFSFDDQTGQINRVSYDKSPKQISCNYYRGPARRVLLDIVTNNPVEIFAAKIPSLGEVRFARGTNWYPVNSYFKSLYLYFHKNGTPKRVDLDSKLSFKIRGRIYSSARLIFDENGRVNPVGDWFDNPYLVVNGVSYNGLKILVPMTSDSKINFEVAEAIADAICQDYGFVSGVRTIRRNIEKYDFVNPEDFYEPVTQKVRRLSGSSVWVLPPSLMCDTTGLWLEPSAIVE